MRVPAETPVGHVGHGVDRVEDRALDERFAGIEELEVDGPVNDLGVPRVERGRRDGAAAGPLGHEQYIPGCKAAPRREVACHADGADATGHSRTEDHVAADAERRARDERDADRVADSRDAGGVFEDFGDIAVVGDVDVREEENGASAHDVDVPERGPGRVEPGEEREVREAGVHAVDRTADVLVAGANRARVVHLVDPDLRRGRADDPGDLAVGEEITRAA